MSKERKFHELIEQQDREEKDRVWAKLRKKDEERIARQKERTEEQEKPKAVLPKTPFAWRKWTVIAASSLAAVVLVVFAVGKFFPSDIHEAGNSEENGDRYFTTLSYDAVKTEISLKEYAQEIGQDLLYFDWYAETEYFKNQVLQLKDTQEIICFQEELVDINTGCIVYIYVTEENIRLESFSEDENTQRVTQVEGVAVNWRMQDDKALLNFVYEDYRYYLRVKEPIDENYVLSLVEELLPEN